LLTKWLGLVEATVVLGGLVGLVTGMYWLATKPMPGVLVMLASVALLLSSAAKLGEAQEIRLGSHQSHEHLSRIRVGSSGR